MRSDNLTEQELQELCRKWQERLRLQDWDIVVRLVRKRDFAIKDGVDGECEWESQNKIAIIRILDPIDYDPDCILEQDIERTLVHELLHLHFALFREEGIRETLLEQAICAISKTLVALARNEI